MYFFTPVNCYKNTQYRLNIHEKKPITHKGILINSYSAKFNVLFIFWTQFCSAQHKIPQTINFCKSKAKVLPCLCGLKYNLKNWMSPETISNVLKAISPLIKLLRKWSFEYCFKNWFLHSYSFMRDVRRQFSIQNTDSVCAC